MTSGDLNIDLTLHFLGQVNSVPQRTMKCRLPFVATIRGFRDLTGCRKGPCPIPSLPELARNKVNRHNLVSIDGIAFLFAYTAIFVVHEI